MVSDREFEAYKDKQYEGVQAVYQDIAAGASEIRKLKTAVKSLEDKLQLFLLEVGYKIIDVPAVTVPAHTEIRRVKK